MYQLILTYTLTRILIFWRMQTAIKLMPNLNFCPRKISGLLLCLALVLPGFGQDTTDINAVVAAVHDGDSYRMKGMEKFSRIAGVDCPELRSPYVTVAQSYGREIGDSVRLFLKGREVRYNFLKIDRHKRPIVRVFVDGYDLAEIILSRGWGWYVHEPKLQKAVRDRYKGLFEQAKRGKRGIFADKNAIHPARHRQKYPGQ